MKKITFFCLMMLAALTLATVSCNKEKSAKGSETYTLTAHKVNLEEMGTKTLNELNTLLLNAVWEGKIKPYRFDSLTANCEYKIDELKRITTLEESVTLTPNQNEPEYTLDTILKKAFKVEDIVGYSVSEKWTFNLENASQTGQIYAFAINWTPKFGPMQVPESPVFWVSFKDLEKILNKEIVDEISKLLHKSFLEKLTMVPNPEPTGDSVGTP
jgi:hypothetical protein